MESSTIRTSRDRTSRSASATFLSLIARGTNNEIRARFELEKERERERSDEAKHSKFEAA